MALAACLGLAGLTDTVAAEANWPQWRGPVANGTAPDANPPTTWSETEHVKWKVKLPGRGTSTPIVWGDQVFIQAVIPTGRKTEAGAGEPKDAAPKPGAAIAPQAVFGQAQGPQGEGQRRRRPGGGGGGFGGGRENPTEIQQFVLLSLDRSTGKTQWQTVVRETVPHEGHHQDHSFESHSPVTDGERIYGWFGSRGLHCFDLKGKKLWEKDFGNFRSANGFGEGNSPALHGNTLVVNWDHEGDDFIAAFDKVTGRELWRTPRNERTTWTTPLVIVHEGKPQVIVCATQRIRSYDLATGRQLWECGGLTANVIPTPISAFDHLYAISGFRGNALLAIKLGRSGDLTDGDAISWRHERSTPYVPSPMLSGDRLFFLAGNNPILSCVDARTGKVHFDAERLQGPSGFYASPVGAAGRIYLAGRNGTSLVIKDATALEVLATNKLEDRFDASPAISGNALFLRGHENLYCLSDK